MSINCSATNIATFTYERYKAVCKPMETHQNQDKSIKWEIIRMWAFNLVWNSPWFFLTTIKNDPENYKPTCSFKLERKSNYYLALFFLDLILFYIIPLLFSAYNYIKIYQNLARRFTFSETTTLNCAQQLNGQRSIVQLSPRSSNHPNEPITDCYESEPPDCFIDTNGDQTSKSDSVKHRSARFFGSFCSGDTSSRPNSMNHREGIFHKVSISPRNVSSHRNSVLPRNSVLRRARRPTDKQNRQVS